MGFSSKDARMTKQMHFIADSRVFCPRVGREVDFERCLACPLLKDIDVDSRHPKVICRLPESDSVEARPPLHA
jgi:hypothetical protein